LLDNGTFDGLLGWNDALAGLFTQPNGIARPEGAFVALFTFPSRTKPNFLAFHSQFHDLS
jgi:hypothetical protein